MLNTDVFLCYRRYGAQTAKLFYRFLKDKQFVEEVWYSDDNPVGNYANDIDELIDSACKYVLFIDEKFTDGFNNFKENECITALEVCAIARKLLKDKDGTMLLTVFLDRKGFTPEENKTLTKLFRDNGIKEAEEATRLFTQNNVIPFSTYTGIEEGLFKKLYEALLSGVAPEKNKGNFCFGKMPTSADIVVYDKEEGIKCENVSFIISHKKPVLYKTIEKMKTDVDYEYQNNHMISLKKCDLNLTDDEENKEINISYCDIEYKLFSKTLDVWQTKKLDGVIAGYTRDDEYELPNAMGLAFMVITVDNKVIMTIRSNNRKIRPGEYDCSIVEGLKPEVYSNGELLYDIDDVYYLDKEIKRAFKEEICDIDDINYKIYGLVLDRQYGQWNFIGVIHTDAAAEEIKRLHPVRNDCYEDNRLIIYDFLNNGKTDREYLKKQLNSLLSREIWGMALTVLDAALKELGYTVKDIEYALER